MRIVATARYIETGSQQPNTDPRTSSQAPAMPNNQPSRKTSPPRSVEVVHGLLTPPQEKPNLQLLLPEPTNQMCPTTPTGTPLDKRDQSMPIFSPSPLRYDPFRVLWNPPSLEESFIRTPMTPHAPPPIFESLPAERRPWYLSDRPVQFRGHELGDNVYY